MSESATVEFAPAVRAAAGVYAPGHLGELTQYLPFELVDDVLVATRTVQRRVRDLPSRVGVYFVLAMTLFPGLGYARIWSKLTAGLVDVAGLRVARPSEKALRDLRRRLGPAPLRELFEIVAGPLGQPHTPGVRHRGLRTVAFDGCHSLKVPDTESHRTWLGKVRYRLGFAGYPTLALMTLIETGTRAVIDATLGSAAHRDEVGLARRLLGRLDATMLVLLDRAFDAAAFLDEIDRTGAKFLVRAKASRKPVILAALPDGSYLADLTDQSKKNRTADQPRRGLVVRVIEAELHVTGTDGSQVRERYRLITSLIDHHQHPAVELIRLYHERWEIESAYLALRHTMLEGHVLRSQDRAGLEQEVWALLTVYQLLRMAMVTAVESQPFTDPDRASFTSALQAARDQVIAAAGIFPTTHTSSRFPTGRVDLIGVIGREVLATLLPARRARWSSRKVKNATSRYLNRDRRRPERPVAIASIAITINTADHDHLPPHPKRRRRPHRARRATPAGPRPGSRRARVIDLMGREPHRTWQGSDLAHELGIPVRNMLTQLAEWTRQGHLQRPAPGAYKLPTRQPAASP